METVRVAAFRRAVGWLTPEQLPMTAAESLASGHDSPALRELAGWSGREPAAELDGLWHRALDELGAGRPDQEAAERWALRDVAARLDAGALGSAREALAAVDGLDSAHGEREVRFRRAVARGCCEDCLADGGEASRRWDAEVRAAAAALVAEREQLRLLALRYLADALPTAELPTAAAELLAAGHDSPALCDLAGRGRGEPASELEPLLRRALDDAGAPCPGRAEAERWLLHDLAAQAADGRLTAVGFAAAVVHRELRGADAAEEALLVLLGQYCPCCCPDRWSAKEFRTWESDVRAAAALVGGRG
ncbi:hypothetical protein ACFV1L_00540 [Kitasatospora sp. NPDC059646]|uniref:hypothetical protein n=1 Tax=Kitasatospora sp. NPDC059646 TaxID=3346893 RepID=UPI0036B78BC4